MDVAQIHNGHGILVYGDIANYMRTTEWSYSRGKQPSIAVKVSRFKMGLMERVSLSDVLQLDALTKDNILGMFES